MPVAAPTAIIPAAGLASRLALPYPKALIPLGPGECLIDSTIQLLRPHFDSINIVVVVRPQCLGAATYLDRYTSTTKLAFCFQNSSLPETIGAVLSAKHLFSDYNVVLLPDQLIEPHPAWPDPVGALLMALDETPFAFLCQSEQRFERLSRDGALAIEATGDHAFRVVDYADKPQRPRPGMNAIWAAFGFRRAVAEEGLQLMHRSTLGHPVTQEEVQASPLFRSRALPVSSCLDLGSWEALRRHYSKSAT